MSTNRYLADRFAIDDLLARYTTAVDRGRWDLLDTVFLPDAVIDYTSAGGIRGGRDEIKAWLARVLDDFSDRQHLIAQRDVSIDGDRATVRASFFNPMVLSAPNGPPRYVPGGGCYHHTLVRTAEGWRSAELIEEEIWRVGLPDDFHVPS